MAGAITRGVLFVHSAPRALCPHVEWAAGNLLGSRTTFDWTAQPAGPGFYRPALDRLDLVDQALHLAGLGRWVEQPEEQPSTVVEQDIEE